LFYKSAKETSESTNDYIEVKDITGVDKDKEIGLNIHHGE
jgi:hypothetical protein